MNLAKPRYVVDGERPFLRLWPHRYDYIWASHPGPHHKPQWQTESYHPLSDRLIQQGSHLYGVRFGSQTQYCLLDVDVGSAYHPQQDPLALFRITAALESLGLVGFVVCTSSYSQGLHLYFPFEIPQNSWQLSAAVTTLLENQGFKCQPGQLEIFPNSKLYVAEGTPNLFNGHRLPLQAGSYLLNSQLEPVESSQERFVQQWIWCQQRNAIDADTIQQILRQGRRLRHRVSQRADKFLNDLNAEIEVGWTGKGQTNYLLGRITMRSYIFHHVMQGGSPLTGEALVDTIVSVAQSLPGYRDWCGHQHEIEHRAAEWARCIENSHYFPYGAQQGRYKAKSAPRVVEKTWNQQRAQQTQEKIKAAMADLLESGDLPKTATARFQVLIGYGIGGSTLYKYKTLWHPAVWQPTEESRTAIGAGASATATPADAPHPTSLLSEGERNPLRYGDLSSSARMPAEAEGRNQTPPPMWTGLLAALKAQQVHQASTLRSQKEARLHSKVRQSSQNYAEKMAGYLRSHDPILIGEGLQWSLSQSAVPLARLLPENFMDWSECYPQLAPLVARCQALIDAQGHSAGFG